MRKIGSPPQDFDIASRALPKLFSYIVLKYETTIFHNKLANVGPVVGGVTCEADSPEQVKDYIRERIRFSGWQRTRGEGQVQSARLQVGTCSLETG